MFQNRAARFVTGNYTTLKLEVRLHVAFLNSKGGTCSKPILLFKSLKGRASIHCDDFQPQIGAVGTSIQWHFVPYARTDIYSYSVFPDTVRDWNTLPAPASIISSAESSEDPVQIYISCEI